MAMPDEAPPPYEPDAWAPPANDQAEQALLGAILANNQAYDRVSDFLRPEHFADGIHARIYAACEHLIGRGQLADAIRLKDYFDAERALEEVGGANYLAHLQKNYVTIINARDYAETIHDCWLRRELLGLGSRLSADAHVVSEDYDGAAMAEQAADFITGLLESGEREGGLSEMGRLAVEVAQRTEAIRNGEVEPGVQTGLTDLDRLTGGLHRQDLVILAGRPSMGKTALATRIAFKVASTLCRETDPDGNESAAPQPVAFFSLEMSAEQLTRRIACERASLEFERTQQRTGLADHEFDAFSRACLDLRRIPLFVDGTPRLSPAQIHARALGMKRRHGLSLIVVDHLGHATAPNRTGNRHLDLSDITKALKATAKRLDVPVVLLCQLNRGVESRDDKRPTLADLRESGAIEEDADCVLFCYRDHYYLQRQEPKRRESDDDEKYSERLMRWEQLCSKAAGKGEVIVAKQRNGALETVPLAFIDRFMRWDNLARDLYGEGQ